MRPLEHGRSLPACWPTQQAGRRGAAHPPGCSDPSTPPAPAAQALLHVSSAGVECRVSCPPACSLLAAQCSPPPPPPPRSCMRCAHFCTFHTAPPLPGDDTQRNSYFRPGCPRAAATAASVAAAAARLLGGRRMEILNPRAALAYHCPHAAAPLDSPPCHPHLLLAWTVRFPAAHTPASWPCPPPSAGRRWCSCWGGTGSSRMRAAPWWRRCPGDRRAWWAARR